MYIHTCIYINTYVCVCVCLCVRLGLKNREDRYLCFQGAHCSRSSANTDINLGLNMCVCVCVCVRGGAGGGQMGGDIKQHNN